jgi:N-acetylglutamate synthase-like GNAT family acetyltransferase
MIRMANKWDVDDIIRMLKNYRSATPWMRLAQCDNEPYIRTLLAQIFAGRGVVFLATREDTTVGLLMAIKNPNIWDPDLMVMQELCYWIDPEWRGGTSGYRLLMAYRDHCEGLKQSGHIEAYTISKMVNSPDLDYERFGFNKLEETWRS